MDLTDIRPLIPRCQVSVDDGMLAELGMEWTRLATAAATQTALSLPGAASQRRRAARGSAKGLLNFLST